MTDATLTPATFWTRVEAALGETDPNLTLQRDPFYSQPEWDVYQLRYDTTGGHRLFAWLSVPHGDGPFPALIRMPDYASVHDIIYTPLRRHAVVLNATHRGQRNSDGIVTAAYPGLLTEGIANPEDWLLLGAYADALRAVDALLAQTVASIGTIALTGTGLGAALALAVAARRQVAAVAADTPLALGHPAALTSGLGYPLGELDDYRRAYPEQSDAMAATLALVNPLSFAGSVTAPVLLSAGRFDRSTCPLPFAEELASALPHCDFRRYAGAAEGGGHEHAQVRAAWLAERLGISLG